MFGLENVIQPWMEDARCANDPELMRWQIENREDQFFDEFSGYKGKGNINHERVKRAEKYCRLCPVQDDCLTHALANEEQGIWAGTTERQRRAMKRRVRKAALEFLARQQEQSPDHNGPTAA